MIIKIKDVNIIKRSLTNILIAVHMSIATILLVIVIMSLLLGNDASSITVFIDIKSIITIFIVMSVCSMLLFKAVDNCNDESDKIMAARLKAEVASKEKASKEKAAKENIKVNEKGIVRSDSKIYNRQASNNSAVDRKLESQLEVVRKERLNK